MNDAKYMELALALAKKGMGHVSPNPMVGAVIVKDGAVIGQGWHQQYGGLHAERNALKDCRKDPAGATLYVTLEPCCHYGKTPPCTEAILESGIRRVVIGTLDPNPLVAGQGAAMLRDHQIQVTAGVLEEECRHLIRMFSKFIATKRPFVRMKYAMTLDGKIATRTGQSKWITGEEARLSVQQARLECSAIMVGVHTVIQDNPALTCRLPGGRNPLRIVCDTRLRTPLTAHVVETAASVPTLIATSCQEKSLQQPYLDRQCRLLELPERNGHIDLSRLMEELGRLGIDSILLEGGGTLNWSALCQQIVDEVQAYIAPKLFGGAAVSPVTGMGVGLPGEAFQLKHASFSQIGGDYCIEGQVVYPCLPES